MYALVVLGSFVTKSYLDYHASYNFMRIYVTGLRIHDNKIVILLTESIFWNL